MALTANITANAASATQIGSAPFRGLRGTLHAHGDFGSGTLTFKFSKDNGTTWENFLDNDGVNKGQFSATGSHGFVVGGNILVGYTLSGATNPDINIRVDQVGTLGGG